MNLTKDEHLLLDRYRRIKKDCEPFQADSWSVPICSFRAGNGTYVCNLKGDYIKED